MGLRVKFKRRLRPLFFGLCGMLFMAWASVHVLNHLRRIPQYRFVPVSRPAGANMMEAGNAGSQPMFDGAMRTERLASNDPARLSKQDEREIIRLVTSRFWLVPQRIMEFDIGLPDKVYVSVQAMPWGREGRLLAGRDKDGWFLYKGGAN